jgi:hypothetical protein
VTAKTLREAIVTRADRKSYLMTDEALVYDCTELAVDGGAVPASSSGEARANLTSSIRVDPGRPILAPKKRLVSIPAAVSGAPLFQAIGSVHEGMARRRRRRRRLLRSDAAPF